MTNEQILKKAIDKAGENGFINDEIQTWWDCLAEEGCYEGLDCNRYLPDINGTIFSHDFAKAFWGEGETPIEYYRIITTDGDVRKVNFKNWELYLREMVLEREPLKYLEKFL